jgi:hypothetical protein
MARKGTKSWSRWKNAVIMKVDEDPNIADMEDELKYDSMTNVVEIEALLCQSSNKAPPGQSVRWSLTATAKQSNVFLSKKGCTLAVGRQP